mgnify:CR=1 FL=1
MSTPIHLQYIWCTNMNNKVFQDYLHELDDDDILTFAPLKFAYKKNNTFLHVFQYVIMKFLTTMGLHST